MSPTATQVWNWVVIRRWYLFGVLVFVSYALHETWEAWRNGASNESVREAWTFCGVAVAILVLMGWLKRRLGHWRS
jgi:hypothetical protein